MDNKKKESPVIVRVEFSETKNLGNHSSRKVAMAFEGPLDELSQSVDLPYLMGPFTARIGVVCDKIIKGEISTKGMDKAIVTTEETKPKKNGKSVVKKIDDDEEYEDEEDEEDDI